MSNEALCQVDSRSVSGFYDIDGKSPGLTDLRSRFMTGDRCDGWITVHLRVILGNAHLESVLQTNVPEPYEASAAAGNNLKEGVPEGLSDTVRGRGNR